MDFFDRVKARLFSGSVAGKVLRAAAGSVGVRALASILGLAVTVMLTRIMGKPGLGTYAYVLSIANLLALIAVFGFDRVIVRETGTAAASKDWGLWRGVTKVGALFSFPLALILAGGVVLSTLVWPGLFKAEYLLPFQALVIVVPLLAMGLVQQATIRGLRWVVSSQVPQQLLRPAFMLAILAAMVWLGYDLDPRAALLWTACAILVAILVGGLILGRARPEGIRKARPVYRTREWLLVCLPVMGVAVANKGSGDIASIILGSVNSPEELADFTVTRQMSKFLRFFFLAVNFSIGPTIAHMYAEGRMDELKTLGPKTVRFGTMLVLPVVIAMLVVPELFLGAYGEEYLGQANVFRVMVCTELVNIVLGSVAIWLMMTGHERLALRGAIAGLIVGVGVNLLLAPSMGAMGSAIAMLSALLVTKLVLTRYIWIHLGINPTLFGRG